MFNHAKPRLQKLKPDTIMYIFNKLTLFLCKVLELFHCDIFELLKQYKKNIIVLGPSQAKWILLEMLCWIYHSAEYQPCFMVQSIIAQFLT